jgi:hypothetical protein
VAEISRFITRKQIPDYVRAVYQVEISDRTIRRWRKQHPISFPSSPEEFDPWFEERMVERALKNSKRIFHSTGFHRPRKKVTVRE